MIENIIMAIFSVAVAFYFLFYRILRKKQNTAINGAFVALFFFSAVRYAAGPLAKFAAQFFK